MNQSLLHLFNLSTSSSLCHLDLTLLFSQFTSIPIYKHLKVNQFSIFQLFRLSFTIFSLIIFFLNFTDPACSLLSLPFLNDSVNTSESQLRLTFRYFSLFFSPFKVAASLMVEGVSWWKLHDSEWIYQAFLKKSRSSSFLFAFSLTHFFRSYLYTELMQNCLASLKLRGSKILIRANIIIELQFSSFFSSQGFNLKLNLKSFSFCLSSLSFLFYSFPKLFSMFFFVSSLVLVHSLLIVVPTVWCHVLIFFCLVLFILILSFFYFSILNSFSSLLLFASLISVLFISDFQLLVFHYVLIWFSYYYILMSFS